MASENKSPPLDELRKLVIDQKKIFLPAEAEGPSLVHLHDTVKKYDQLVSQVVISTIQGLPTNPPIENETINQSQEAVELALADPEIAQNRKVDFYRGYINRLNRMLQLANQTNEGQQE